MRVLVVGSFNVDHVWRVASLPAHGATLSGSYATGPGGKGFNQAVAARRAGPFRCWPSMSWSMNATFWPDGRSSGEEGKATTAARQSSSPGKYISMIPRHSPWRPICRITSIEVSR